MSHHALEQLELDGTHVVEASAGTGKTHALVTLYIRLLRERLLLPANIVVVTFTEAASTELRARIDLRLRETLANTDEGTGLHRHLTAALRSLDLAPVTTIHGFCHRLLREHALECGVPLSFELCEDDRSRVRAEVEVLWQQALADAPAPFHHYLRSEGLSFARFVELGNLALSRASATIVPLEPPPKPALDFAPWNEAFDSARALWQAHSGEVSSALLTHEGLNRRSYPLAKRQAFLNGSEGFFRGSTRPPMLRPPDLSRFTAEAFAQHTTKTYLAAGGTPLTHRFFDATQALHREATALEQCFADLAVRVQHTFIRNIRASHNEQALAARSLSFDDLLAFASQAVAGKHGKALITAARKQHQAALVDEFQDTDDRQWAIVRRLFGEQTFLALVGDPKQAIYGFRGASVHTYLAARQVSGHQHALRTNYRAAPALLRGLDALWDVQHPFIDPGIAFAKVEAARDEPHHAHAHAHAQAQAQAQGLRVCVLRRGSSTDPMPASAAAQRVPHAVAQAIEYALAHEGRAPGNMAVVTRTNAQADAVVAALRARNIAAIVYGDRSVFESDEARELYHVLRAVVHPHDLRFLRTALATSLFGRTANELAEPDVHSSRWLDFADTVHQLHHTWTSTGFFAMFRDLAARTGFEARLLSHNKDARALTNFHHLAELCHTEEVTGFRAPMRMLAWLRRNLTSKVQGSAAARMRLERDDDAVHVMTVHRSKGLEYDDVYVPYAWQAERARTSDLTFPCYYDQTRATTVIDVRGGEHRDAACEHVQRERQAEERRLFYVAVTRARERTTLFCGAFRGWERSPLGQLLAAPSAAYPLPDHFASDDDFMRDLQLRGNGCIDVQAVDAIDAVGTAATLSPTTTPTLGARTFTRTQLPTLRAQSFTQLTSASHEPQTNTPASAELDESNDDTLPLADLETRATQDERPSPLADVPSSAATGTFVHAIVERVPHQANLETIAAAVTAHPDAQGWSKAALAALSQGIHRILHSVLPLAPEPFALADLSADDIVREFPFCMHVHPARDERSSQSAWIEAFAAYPVPGCEGYSEQLAKLPRVPIEGFVRGSIDAVVRHKGRYFLLDYKTNDLGPTMGDYARAPLCAAMQAGHYVLQYHLYLVALVRHLRARDASFDITKHLGGVAYPFVRGLPGDNSGAGIFTECPPPARLARLDALL